MNRIYVKAFLSNGATTKAEFNQGFGDKDPATELQRLFRSGLDVITRNIMNDYPPAETPSIIELQVSIDRPSGKAILP